MIDKLSYLQKKSVRFIDSEMPISKIGIGTYLGSDSESDSRGYIESIVKAALLGCNVIDTAINYRGMLSEKNVGEAIKKIIDGGGATREQLVIATKGGFVPCNWINQEPRESIELQTTNFIKNNILPVINVNQDVIKNIFNHYHSIDNNYIEYMFNYSLNNLDLDYLDIYYLHNPEKSAEYLSKDEIYIQIFESFSFLESMVKMGKLKYYGLSTYNAFLHDRDNMFYLDLEIIVELAKKAGGEGHHFKYIQLPYNKALRNAGELKNQMYNNVALSTIDSAYCHGINIITNMSLNQVKSKDQYSIDDMIQFLIENEKISSSLIGMKKPSRVIENMSHINNELEL
ncbi:aldo/keto reductase [Vibrio aestuarianus]|uniref:aldo/keto reductase n=1 Tax=Vibrio aestuarianus TaxID=28171 RepID=UPI0015946194|nr:aldo/keto reductase [Vibrio aestuarianus]NGZ19249.1 aldo/keto reductase [Vibrio aestuarianus]